VGKLDEFVLKDKISAKLCEKACADLKTLGLSARIVKEYRAEEKVGINLDEVAKGHLIEIRNSPITNEKGGLKCRLMNSTVKNVKKLLV
jgi:hypothetical protein